MDNKVAKTPASMLPERENSCAINALQCLYLALNDVAAFERLVLGTGKNCPQNPQASTI